MHSLKTIEAIARLLEEGRLSRRKIAAQLGVSRGTVNAVANGSRGLHGRDASKNANDARSPCHPPQRCPQCGFLIYVPCLVCRAREYRESGRLQRELALLRHHVLARRPGRATRDRSRNPRRSRVA